MRTKLFIGLIALIAAFSPEASLGAELAPVNEAFEAPNDPYTLKVRGDEGVQNVSITDIESLDLYEITMEAPGGGNGTFAGVLLADLLKKLNIGDAKRIYLRAADDYKITIEPDVDKGFDQILFATRLDGQTMSIANKGPFRLIWAHNADDVEAGTASSVDWIWSIVEIRKAR